MMLNLDKSSWRRVRLGDVVDRRRTQVSRDDVKSYAAGKHFPNDGIHLTARGNPDDGGMGSTFTYGFEPGDVLYVSASWHLRKVAVATYSGVVADKTYVLRSKDDRILLQELVPWIIKSDALFGYASREASGSMNARLLWGALAKFEFDLPPLNEQKLIANLLWATERNITAVHMNARSSRLAEAAFRKSFIESFPADSTGAELFDISLGRQRAPQHHAGDHMLPYIRSANVTGSGIDTSDVRSMNFTPEEQKRFALRHGDVLVSEGSASASAVGIPAEWTEEVPGVVCFQKTLLRYRAINSVSIQPYVYQWCLWAHESGEFYRRSSGTNIYHITAVGAKNMKIAKPPIDAQHRFVSRMEKRPFRI